MQKWRQSETADGEEWQLALEREAVIRPLASRGKLSVTLIEEVTRRLQLSRTVFYDLLRRYKQRPQTSSLLPLKRGREFKATFLDRPREELLNSCIQEFYLRMERPTLAALVREVRLRFSLQGLPAPHYRTIRGRIGELDLKLSLQKREGAKKAREQVGRVSVSSLRPENPMELIQIDHTPVDVIVVDQEQRLPIGRPWLTLAIDVTTRMVVGFHISLWAPSTVSLCLALSHAVLPKDSWLADRELQNLEWPAGGLATITILIFGGSIRGIARRCFASGELFHFVQRHKISPLKRRSLLSWPMRAAVPSGFPCRNHRSISIGCRIHGGDW